MRNHRISPFQEAAEELGIEKYMLEWIMAERKVNFIFTSII